MKFDFTTESDRREYPAKKWTQYDPDVLPLWVADMDFAVPPVISQALRHRIDKHPLFGYIAPPSTLLDSLCSWSKSHYGWEIQADWQYWLAGVVPALHLASLIFTQPDEELLTVTPIYPPFLAVGKQTGRTIHTVPMLEPDDAEPFWRLDKEGLESAVTDKTRLLLWCNPQNPTGRVFGREELEWLADFIDRHDLIVCSDELHCDLILDKQRQHIPLAMLNERIAKRTITLWAATKTFNIAGLTCACAVISDRMLRARFMHGCEGLMPSQNILGLVATEAAYTQGEPWRQELLEVLRRNCSMLESHAAQWPGIRFYPPQGSYLAWLDCREAGLGKSPQQTLLKEARVALSDGADFGLPGFVRVNLATQANRMDEALNRMDTVLKKVRE